MGKWSEDMSVVVTHSQRDAVSNVARDTSGDVICVMGYTEHLNAL